MAIMRSTATVFKVDIGNYKLKIVLASISLLFILSFSSFPVSQAVTLGDISNLNSMADISVPLSPHDPIQILNDSQFDSGNGVKSGSGTISDPYVISGWDISASYDNGIHIEKTVSHFIIRDCSIHSTGPTGKSGVSFNVVKYGTISNCTFNNCTSGITVTTSFFVNFTDNQATDCTNGIHMAGSSAGHIQNNSLWNNTNGIYFSSAKGGIVSYNDILNNKDYGIFASGWTTGMKIHHNNFVGNAGGFKQGRDEYSYDQWNSSLGGNYWSDWTGPDTSPKDGIVDLPYNISGKGILKDYKPLVSPVDNNPIIIPEIAPTQFMLASGAVAFVLILIVTPTRAIRYKRSVTWDEETPISQGF